MNGLSAILQLPEFIPTEIVYLINILLGGILGLLVGLERSRRQKEAGMATHFAVGLASSLLTCLSHEMAKNGGDPARIAAQIVTGIGFLGAGMIFYRRESLHGLTTAAGVWATAAIGMTAGSGLYVLAICCTLVIIAVQLVLHTKPLRWHYQRVLLLKFTYSEEATNKIRKYFGIEKFSRFKMAREGNVLMTEAVIRPTQNGSAETIASFINENDFVTSIERLEDL